MRRTSYGVFPSLIVALFIFFLPVDAHAQSTGIVEGRIVDASGGSPLPGANVVVEGTSIGTSTDQNGRYQLTSVPTGSQTLTVSFVSYQTTSETVEVSAGQTVTLDVALSSRVLEGGEVVVRGIRESQFRSVNQKRQSMNIVDALAADRIGNLPEKNVAEAVQRLPGIVLRNDRTEGRFVSIRGGAANLNNVTLNGNTLASTAGSRATALDLLPAEMVSNVEVTKAVTPDMPANAIGGSVNINTLSAFDRSGSFAFGTLRGLSHQQQVPSLADTKFPFRANLTAGTKLGSDNDIGLLVSASGSRRDFTTSGLKGEGWDVAPERDLDVAVPYAQEQIVERNLRRRFALNASLDWRPTQQTSVYFRPYYTYTDERGLDNELEYNLTFDAAEGDPGPTTQGSKVGFARGFGSVDLSDTDEQESLWGGNLGFEQQFGGAVTWSASGTFSRGVTDSRSEDGEFETSVRDGINTRGGGVADMSGFLFDFYPKNPNYIGNGANYDANDLSLEFEESIENTYAAKTDLRVPFEAGSVSGFLKTGGQLQRRSKSIDVSDVGFEYVGSGDLTLGDFSAPGVQTVQVGNGLMPFADTGQFENAFLGELCNPNVDQPFSGERRCQSSNAVYERASAADLAISDLEDDSQNDESIYAGYAMASAEFGPLTALAGLRVEHTSTSTTRYQLVTGQSEPEQQNFDNAYTHVLPSVHLTLEASDDLQFRGAWTNTIGRPEYDDLGAFSEVDTTQIQPGLFNASVSRGNPDLSPFEAMNFDLSAEYYFPNGGMASAAGFYKMIDNPIYTFSRTERDVSNFFGEGRQYRTVNISQQRNANQGNVLGLELTYQQPFTFLLSPLSGLGLNSNLTIANSEVDVPEREGDLPFFQQSDMVYNVIPYFQQGGFEARVAVNFQGEYLAGLDDTPAEDTYVDDRTTVDVNASYQAEGILGQPELLVQVENLTNAPEVEYAGQPGHLAYHYLSGRTVTVGLSTEF
jgi:TonB-dependent receptor